MTSAWVTIGTVLLGWIFAAVIAHFKALGVLQMKADRVEEERAHSRIRLDLQEELNRLRVQVNDKLDRDAFQKSLNGIRNEVTAGMKEINESYQETRIDIRELNMRMDAQERRHGD